jgi:aldose 1-epimerase
MNSSVQRSAFGALPDGSPVELFTLTNATGMSVRATNYGTIVTELQVPDRDGTPGDVVLGFDRLEPYLAGHPYFGCTVGRVANRIANAIIEVDSVHFPLTRNSGPHHLHGGTTGFDKVRWEATVVEGPMPAVRFAYTSPDGDQGYPGQLDATVTMSLGDDNALTIEFTAHTNRTTPISLTNHSYFNLAGGGDVLSHELQLNASRYTPTGHDLIPTGRIAQVQGTPLDFTSAVPIGTRIAEMAGDLPGYDHNYVLEGESGSLRFAARLRDPASGRILTIETTEPAMQCYTGNALDGSITGKAGQRYACHAAICLEPQRFPDALHHEAFPSNLVRPGEEYRQVTRYHFSAE